MNAFDLLWKLLVDQRNGFGRIEKHRLGCAYFHEVMYVGTSEENGKTYIYWTHAGSSAEKCTKENLRWLLKEIYHMTPAEFLSEYTTFHEYLRIDRMYKGE